MMVHPWEKPLAIRQAYEDQLCKAVKREVRGARAFNRYAMNAKAKGHRDAFEAFKFARDRFMSRARQRRIEYYASLNGTT